MRPKCREKFKQKMIYFTILYIVSTVFALVHKMRHGQKNMRYDREHTLRGFCV